MKKYPKKADQKAGENSYIISCEIVQRSYVNKAGKKIDRKEYYLRRSIQDYFVKFCESKVTKEEFQQAYEKETGFIKTLRLEVEFKEGSWDDCGEGEEPVQSRIGTYAIIHKIF